MKRYDNIERSDIGERINQLRTRKNLTLKKLADKLGITDGALSMKLSGKRPFTADELFTISDIFDLTLDELVRGVRTENVNAQRATGLGERAISALHWFSSTETIRKRKALNKALSHHQVLDAIARYVCFVPKNPGFYLSERITGDEQLVNCTMSQRVYQNVLGQNLINMLDEIRSGKEYSRGYNAYEEFSEYAQNENEMNLAEPSEFEKENDSDETTER